MKSILLSTNPEWVAKILNGEKTIEIRKVFPKDFEGWVYVYCTKTKGQYLVGSIDKKCEILKLPVDAITKPPIETLCGNGKVVARFWCDKVEEIDIYTNRIYETKTLNQLELLEKSCLTHSELFEYLGEDYSKIGGYAIHISKLEVFDRPRELKEFNRKIVYQPKTKPIVFIKPLTKAPQNYCFIETEK